MKIWISIGMALMLLLAAVIAMLTDQGMFGMVFVGLCCIILQLAQIAVNMEKNK